MFSDWCVKYTDIGLNVTPLNGKRPFLSEWQLANHDYDELVDKYPKCNIGLICGELSGVIALDIDLTDNDLIQRVMAIIPPSEVRKRGAKGLTLFYRYQGEVNGKLFFNGQTAVELLSTGNQTVLPPSIHPDTKLPYKWDHYGLTDISPYDLPILDYERTWPRLQHLFSEKKSQSKAKFSDITTAQGRSPHGSFLRLQNIASKITKERMPFDKAVKYLIDKDHELHHPHGGITYFGEHPLNIIHARKFLAGIQETFIKRQLLNNLPIELPVEEVEPIKDLIAEKYTVPSISESCMPEILWKYCHNQARSSETSVDYIFMSTLVSIITPLGDKIAVKPKKNSSYKWRPKMSVILVGDPSVRKSGALQIGLAPFKASLKMLKQMKAKEIEDVQEKIKFARGQLKNFIKKSEKEPDNKFLIKEILDTEKAIIRLEQNPLLKSWIVNNITVQSLMKIFSEHSGSYLQEWDEISGWLEFIEQKTQAGARAEFLSLINQGITDYRVDRKDKELSVFVDYAHVNLIGTTQPNLIKPFIAKEDGLIQRFQIVYPDFTKPTSMTDEKEDVTLIIPLAEKIFDLIINPISNYFEVSKDGLGILKFNDDSYDIYFKFDQYLREIQIGASSRMISYYDKAMSFFFNLCSIYYFLEFKADQEKTIQKNHAEMAVKTTLVFFEHVKRVYSPDEYVDVKSTNTKTIIMQIILDSGKKEFNATFIVKKKKSLDINEVDATLKAMASEDKIKPTGKKVKGSRHEIYTLS
jgi:hypothetical protein